MTQEVVDRSLDKQLDKTEIGQFIARHKVSFLGGIAVIVVALLGNVLWSQHREKQRGSDAAVVAEFKEKNWSLLVNDSKADAFVTRLKDSFKLLSDKTVFNGVVLEASDWLLENQKYALGLDLLDHYQLAVGRTNAPTTFLLGLRRAVFLEEEKKYLEAAQTLKGLVALNLKVMEEKLYFDLGRLYLLSGDKEKAKSSFQYVVDELKDPEFVKLSKLYLQEMQGAFEKYQKAQ